MREMIRDRYLCPITGWRVDTDLSLDNVKVRGRHGDFVESQLARVVNTPSRNNLLVKDYRDFAPRRRTIVFCVDVSPCEGRTACFCRSRHLSRGGLG
jgi:ATP-dependent helicase IRC3